MREEISCVITGKNANELDPGDYLVSLNAENSQDGVVRHYYSYAALLEWYTARYKQGYSLAALSTQVP